MPEPPVMDTRQLAILAKQLSDTLREDVIVSEEIKQLAWVVGLLAESAAMADNRLADIELAVACLRK